MAARYLPCRRTILLGLILFDGTSAALAATDVPPWPDVTDGPEDPARFETRLSGFIQADAVPYAQSSEDQITPVTGEPLNRQRFLVRHAQLHLQTRQGHDATPATSADLTASNRWHGPSAPGSYFVWAILHDDRGGLDFARLAFTAQ